MMTSFYSRREFTRLLAVAGLAAIVPAAALTGARAQAPTAITVRMGYTWASSQYYALYLLGKAKGFYAEVGLDPTFVEGTGSGVGVQLIGSGQVDFGAAIASGAVINGVSKGAKVRMVAATLPSNPIAVLSKTSAPLLKPADLIGKTIGMPPGSEQEQLWPAFLKVNGLNASDIEVVSIAGDALPAALSQDRIAGYVSYSTDLPFIEKTGMKVTTMLFSDFGIVYAPGEGIVVSEETLASRPEIVRAFVAATQKAFEYGLAHPDEAAKAAVEAFPDAMQEDVTISTVGIAGELFEKAGGPAKVFAMSEPQWQTTIDLLQTYGGLKDAAPASGYFTNDYLPPA